MAAYTYRRCPMESQAGGTLQGDLRQSTSSSDTAAPPRHKGGLDTTVQTHAVAAFHQRRPAACHAHMEEQQGNGALQEPQWEGRILHMVNDFLYKGEIPVPVQHGMTILLPKTQGDPPTCTEQRQSQGPPQRHTNATSQCSSTSTTYRGGRHSQLSHQRRDSPHSSNNSSPENSPSMPPQQEGTRETPDDAENPRRQQQQTSQKKMERMFSTGTASSAVCSFHRGGAERPDTFPPELPIHVDAEMHLRSLPHGAWAGITLPWRSRRAPEYVSTSRGYCRIRVRRARGSRDPAGYMGTSTSFVLFWWGGITGGRPGNGFSTSRGAHRRQIRTLRSCSRGQAFRWRCRRGHPPGNWDGFNHVWRCNITTTGGI